ncbi:DUF2059 domain-containing protein [Metallibacterium scheffleri]|nr:DUF2059 domain-containing protein [Metallibacterium scheffleri]
MFPIKEKTMRPWIAAGAVLLALGLGTATAADAPPAQPQASSASVHELLVATHATTMMQQVMQQMAQQLDAMVKQRLPCLAPGEVSSVLTTPQATRQMTDLVVPIYQRNFTEQDVRELLTFYRSPLGQKMLEVQPAIMRESMLAGEQFGRQQFTQRISQLETTGKLNAEGQCPVSPAAKPAAGG